MTGELLDLTTLKDFGFPAIAFFILYIFSTRQLNKMSNQLNNITDKIFAQSDKTMDYISANTSALQKLADMLEEHSRLKEAFIDTIKECRTERNNKLEKLEDKIERIQ